MSGSVLAIFALLMISAAFAGIEAGLLSVNRARLRTQKDRGDQNAQLLSKLLDRPGELLATVLIVTNLVNIGALALIVRLLVNAVGPYGYLLALILAWPIFVFVVEVLPKSLFRRFPYRALAMMARILWVARALLLPFLYILDRLGAFRSSDRDDQTSIFVARQEMKFVTQEGERLGTMTEEERRLIHRVIDFRALRLTDVMVPFSEVTYVKIGTPVEEAIEVGLRHDLDRLPVLGEDGQFVGLVNVLDLLFDQQPDTTVNQYLRRMIAAKENASTFPLIRRLRAARLTMAAVVDEDDRPLGIVGIENVMNRLVHAAIEEETPRGVEPKVV